MKTAFKSTMITLMVLWGGLCLAQAENPGRLTVAGEATLNVAADRMQVNISVVTEADTAEGAVQHNSAKAARVEKALRQAGVARSEYQTGQFRVQPRWSPRPRDAAQDWRPHIVGYTVTNQLRVQSPKLALAAKLIEAGIKAGADNIDALHFDLADPSAHRTAAIEKATANAIAAALALARAAGVKLDRILDIRLDGAAPRPQTVRMASFAESAMAMDTVPISPGDVSVHASVTVTYGIRPEE